MVDYRGADSSQYHRQSAPLCRAPVTITTGVSDKALTLESLPHRVLESKDGEAFLKLIYAQYLIHYRIQEQKKLVEIVAFGHGAQIK